MEFENEGRECLFSEGFQTLYFYPLGGLGHSDPGEEKKQETPCTGSSKVEERNAELTLEQRLEIEKENVKRCEDDKLALESLIKVQAIDLSDQKKEYELKISEKDRKLKKYKAELSKLAEQKKAKGKESEDAREKEKKRENKRILELKRELADKTEQIQSLESRAAELTSRVAESEKFNRDLQAKVDLCDDQSKKIFKLEKENERLLKSETNAKDQQKRKNDDDKDQMKKKLKKYKEDLSEKSNKITELKKEKESKEKIINLLTIENKDVTEKLKAKEKSLKPDQKEFEILKSRGREQKQEIESLRSKLEKSQALCEESERQTKDLSERIETLERTNKRLEDLMVEVTHVMKKKRTETDEVNDDEKKNSRFPSSEIDDSSNMSDGIEIFVNTESFDEEQDKTPVKEKQNAEIKLSKYPEEPAVESREQRNDQDSQKTADSLRDTSEIDKRRFRKRSKKESNRQDSRDRSSSRRSRDERHSDRRRNRAENTARDRKEKKSSCDFKRVKTSDKNERYIRYI